MNYLISNSQTVVVTMFKMTWSKLAPGARRLSMAEGRESWGTANVLLGKEIIGQ